MRIGIIGSGKVGGALGTRWGQSGHEVVFGSRDPEAPHMKELAAKAGGNASTATLAETAKTGEILLLATPQQSNQQVLMDLGDLTGKILIDATNPFLPQLAGLKVGTTTSGGEQVASWAQGAKVVKAFNTVGFNIMSNPDFGGERPVMFYCGDDTGAKASVKKLVEDVGFEAVDAGPLQQARLLEPFSFLWVTLASFYGLGREFAFKLIRR
jgi:predicted dinucleotide-binding enzyme